MLAVLLILAAGIVSADCLDCHESMRSGFSAGHAGFAADCSRCHAGDATADVKDAAHRGLLAFPGNLANAERACGDCHAARVGQVSNSLMHTGTGLVHTTRRVFGEPPSRPGRDTLSTLGDTPADNLLRKLCAGCHLGQEKTRHRLDLTRDRGGGCLACHINDYPDEGHPRLSATVGDGRCFGCHSRSGRISLGYAGLAEVLADATRRTGEQEARLQDGRRVQSMPADVHHDAGMACIDCHTERGLMGSDEHPTRQRQAVDIACEDCHLSPRRVRLSQWPAHWNDKKRRIPFPADSNVEFPLTARGTPLWNVELRDGRARLYRKDGNGALEIPPYTPASHPLAAEHRRLACASCHSQWAPQCYGCHLEYDPAGRQYDHLTGEVSAGRWNESRSDVRNALPPLGVADDGRVVPVVPGMIMTVTHPQLKGTRLIRRFASLAPHTTGSARDCDSCHRSPVALGLGEGRLERAGDSWDFAPRHEKLADGLPADAWTDLAGTAPEPAPFGVRPFTAEELRSLLDASAD